jgi:hypothetical protein
MRLIFKLKNGALNGVLGLMCLVILSGILVAGLWPFHAPRNEVSWLSNGNGLLFGRYGSVVSAGTFKAKGTDAENACSLEIWLEPRRLNSSGTVLAFYRPESRVVPFALRQSLGDLVLQRRSQNQLRRGEKTKIYVDDVFIHQGPVLLTISSGQAGTTIYANGALLSASPNFRLSSQDLTGFGIIGNDPATTHNWVGQVKGLAIYDHELSSDEVQQDYSNWTHTKRPSVAKGEGVEALYLFNEDKGSVIHNQVDSATDLLIPDRFFVLNEQFLERPWDEFYLGWHYWEDIGVNIAGFIPLGFFWDAYFSTVGKIRRATWLTIALGFSVSFAVEVMQSFLPTRDSGMTDLITNTFGTALGATLWTCTVRNAWFV